MKNISASVVTVIQPAGPNHQVVRVEGGHGGYRRKPCGGCPWKCENDGSFPAQAFEHSASTSYDMAQPVFSCHESGLHGHTCAGFLLNGAAHNLSVRLGMITGRYAGDITDGGHALHRSYAEMAVANGVDPDSPALELCRS